MERVVQSLTSMFGILEECPCCQELPGTEVTLEQWVQQLREEGSGFATSETHNGPLLEGLVLQQCCSDVTPAAPLQGQQGREVSQGLPSPSTGLPQIPRVFPIASLEMTSHSPHTITHLHAPCKSLLGTRGRGRSLLWLFVLFFCKECGGSCLSSIPVDSPALRGH